MMFSPMHPPPSWRATCIRTLPPAAMALFGGCRAPEPVRIGVAFPSRDLVAASLAAESLNVAGSVNGRRVVIVHDTLGASGSRDLEVERAQWLVAQGPLVGVVGHISSHGSLVAAPIYARARVVQIVPTGTSRLLSTAGAWTLPMAPSDSVEGAVIVGFLTGVLHARTVVIAYSTNEYGLGLRDGVVAALAGRRVTLLRELRHDLGTDLRALVDRAIAGGVPDVMVVAGHHLTVTGVARELAARRLPTRVVAGDGAVVLPDLADGVAEAGAGRVYAATFWLPGTADSSSLRFAAEFRARAGREATATDALIYDAVMLLARAVREVGDEPEAVRSYLETLGRSRPRYDGVTGPIGFGAAAGPPRLVMGVIKGRSLEPLEAPGR